MKKVISGKLVAIQASGSDNDDGIEDIKLSPELFEFLIKNPVCGRSDYTNLPGAKQNNQSPWRLFQYYPRRQATSRSHESRSTSTLNEEVSEERRRKFAKARLQRQQRHEQQLQKKQELAAKRHAASVERKRLASLERASLANLDGQNTSDKGERSNVVIISSPQKKQLNRLERSRKALDLKHKKAKISGMSRKVERTNLFSVFNTTSNTAEKTTNKDMSEHTSDSKSPLKTLINEVASVDFVPPKKLNLDNEDDWVIKKLTGLRDPDSSLEANSSRSERGHRSHDDHDSSVSSSSSPKHPHLPILTTLVKRSTSQGSNVSDDTEETWSVVSSSSHHNSSVKAVADSSTERRTRRRKERINYFEWEEYDDLLDDDFLKYPKSASDAVEDSQQVREHNQGLETVSKETLEGNSQRQLTSDTNGEVSVNSKISSKGDEVSSSVNEVLVALKDKSMTTSDNLKNSKASSSNNRNSHSNVSKDIPVSTLVSPSTVAADLSSNTLPRNIHPSNLSQHPTNFLVDPASFSTSTHPQLSCSAMVQSTPPNFLLTSQQSVMIGTSQSSLLSCQENTGLGLFRNSSSQAPPPTAMPLTAEICSTNSASATLCPPPLLLPCGPTNLNFGIQGILMPTQPASVTPHANPEPVQPMDLPSLAWSNAMMPTPLPFCVNLEPPRNPVPVIAHCQAPAFPEVRSDPRQEIMRHNSTLSHLLQFGQNPYTSSPMAQGPVNSFSQAVASKTGPFMPGQPPIGHVNLPGASQSNASSAVPRTMSMGNAMSSQKLPKAPSTLLPQNTSQSQRKHPVPKSNTHGKDSVSHDKKTNETVSHHTGRSGEPSAFINKLPQTCSSEEPPVKVPRISHSSKEKSLKEIDDMLNNINCLPVHKSVAAKDSSLKAQSPSPNEVNASSGKRPATVRNDLNPQQSKKREFSPSTNVVPPGAPRASASHENPKLSSQKPGVNKESTTFHPPAWERPGPHQPSPVYITRPPLNHNLQAPPHSVAPHPPAASLQLPYHHSMPAPSYHSSPMPSPALAHWPCPPQPSAKHTAQSHKSASRQPQQQPPLPPPPPLHTSLGARPPHSRNQQSQLPVRNTPSINAKPCSHKQRPRNAPEKSNSSHQPRSQGAANASDLFGPPPRFSPRSSPVGMETYVAQHIHEQMYLMQSSQPSNRQDVTMNRPQQPGPDHQVQESHRGSDTDHPQGRQNMPSGDISAFSQFNLQPGTPRADARQRDPVKTSYRRALPPPVRPPSPPRHPAYHPPIHLPTIVSRPPTETSVASAISPAPTVSVSGSVSAASSAERRDSEFNKGLIAANSQRSTTASFGDMPQIPAVPENQNQRPSLKSVKMEVITSKPQALQSSSPSSDGPVLKVAHRESQIAKDVLSSCSRVGPPVSSASECANLPGPTTCQPRLSSSSLPPPTSSIPLASQSSFSTSSNIFVAPSSSNDSHTMSSSTSSRVLGHAELTSTCASKSLVTSAMSSKTSASTSSTTSRVDRKPSISELARALKASHSHQEESEEDDWQEDSFGNSESEDEAIDMKPVINHSSHLSRVSHQLSYQTGDKVSHGQTTQATYTPAPPQESEEDDWHDDSFGNAESEDEAVDVKPVINHPSRLSRAGHQASNQESQTRVSQDPANQVLLTTGVPATGTPAPSQNASSYADDIMRSLSSSVSSNIQVIKANLSNHNVNSSVVASILSRIKTERGLNLSTSPCLASSIFSSSASSSSSSFSPLTSMISSCSSPSEGTENSQDLPPQVPVNSEEEANTVTKTSHTAKSSTFDNSDMPGGQCGTGRETDVSSKSMSFTLGMTSIPASCPLITGNPEPIVSSAPLSTLLSSSASRDLQETVGKSSAGVTTPFLCEAASNVIQASSPALCHSSTSTATQVRDSCLSACLSFDTVVSPACTGTTCVSVPQTQSIDGKTSRVKELSLANVDVSTHSETCQYSHSSNSTEASTHSLTAGAIVLESEKSSPALSTKSDFTQAIAPVTICSDVTNSARSVTETKLTYTVSSNAPLEITPATASSEAALKSSCAHSLSETETAANGADTNSPNHQSSQLRSTAQASLSLSPQGVNVNVTIPSSSDITVSTHGTTDTRFGQRSTQQQDTDLSAQMSTALSDGRTTSVTSPISPSTESPQTAENAVPVALSQSEKILTEEKTHNQRANDKNVSSDSVPLSSPASLPVSQKSLSAARTMTATIISPSRVSDTFVSLGSNTHITIGQSDLISDLIRVKTELSEDLSEPENEFFHSGIIMSGGECSSSKSVVLDATEDSYSDTSEQYAEDNSLSLQQSNVDEIPALAVTHAAEISPNDSEVSKEMVTLENTPALNLGNTQVTPSSEAKAVGSPSPTQEMNSGDPRPQVSNQNDDTQGCSVLPVSVSAVVIPPPESPATKPISSESRPTTNMSGICSTRLSTSAEDEANVWQVGSHLEDDAQIDSVDFFASVVSPPALTSTVTSPSESESPGQFTVVVGSQNSNVTSDSKDSLKFVMLKEEVKSVDVVSSIPAGSPCLMKHEQRDITSSPAPTPTPAVVLAQTPAVVLVQTPAVVPAQTPAVVLAQTPAVVPAQTPAIVPAQTPAVVPAQTPAVVPAQTPAVVPAQTPAVVPAQTPAVVPAQTPAVVPAQTPVVVPVQTPTVVPVQTPAIVPAQTPAVVAASGDTSPCKKELDVNSVNLLRETVSKSLNLKPQNQGQSDQNSVQEAHVNQEKSGPEKIRSETTNAPVEKDQGDEETSVKLEDDDDDVCIIENSDDGTNPKTRGFNAAQAQNVTSKGLANTSSDSVIILSDDDNDDEDGCVEIDDSDEIIICDDSPTGNPRGAGAIAESASAPVRDNGVGQDVGSSCQSADSTQPGQTSNPFEDTASTISSSSSVSGASSVITNRSINALGSWSKEKVSAWLKKNKLDKICLNLGNLDGPGLQRMAFECHRDHEVFYSRVKKSLGLTMFNTLVIIRSLKSLVQDDEDEIS